MGGGDEHPDPLPETKNMNQLASSTSGEKMTYSTTSARKKGGAILSRNTGVRNARPGFKKGPVSSEQQKGWRYSRKLAMGRITAGLFLTDIRKTQKGGRYREMRGKGGRRQWSVKLLFVTREMSSRGKKNPHSFLGG